MTGTTGQRRLSGGAGTRGIVLVALLVAGCGHGFPPPDLPPFDPIPEPAPDEVDAVLFLVGDAGAAETGTSPLLEELRADVEHWAGALGRDSAVMIAFLGDNVYPNGLRAREHRGFAADSARLWSQVGLLAGPEAREHRAVGWFLAGNHDWGGMVGEEGVARLRNQQEALDRARPTGPVVRLIPEAGSPGPAIHDLGSDYRFVFIDTHWFLQRPPRADREVFFDALERSIASAGEREIIAVSHHPWRTSGPHGVSEGGRALGYYYLLEKSGTLVQDLKSPVYGDLIQAIRARFVAAGRRPLVFAGGHDHSLQVFEALVPTDPVTSLVSGSGSKLSPVSDADGLQYAASRPGYMTLVFTKRGALDLFVTAGSREHLSCASPRAPRAGQSAAEDRATCMREGAAFETVYSSRLLQEGERNGRIHEGAGDEAGP